MKSKNNIIVVDSKEISTQIREISIFDLTFWTENPRIDSIIKERFPLGNATENDIEQSLWELDSVKELYQDIKLNGGLIDEILVKGTIVLEGNSRLCAYRNLYKRAVNHEEREKWSRIRARVIPDETSNETIFTILGTWHIKGKSEWKTFEKASYIYKMNNVYGKTTKEIANMVKHSETEVKNMIETYTLMKNKGIAETSEQRKFSAIYEIVKNRELKRIKEEDPSIFDKCIDAVKDNKFERAEAVRDLPKIINDKKAKKAFFEEEESFLDALDIAKARHPEHEDSFYSQVRKVVNILKSCPAKRIEEIKLDSNKKYIIKSLYTEAGKLCKKTGII